MVGFFLFSLERVGKIYIDKSQETIYEIKRDFLKDTVNNLIQEIDERRELKRKHLDKLLSRVTNVISMRQEEEDDTFDAFFTDFFTNNPDYEFMTVLLWNKEQNKAIFDPKHVALNSFEETIHSATKNFATHRIIERKNEYVFLAITNSYLEERVKEEVGDLIRITKFDEGTYIWVNEILNYQGGDDYAIRRIHPNLPDTEGTYLSTNTTDIKGNHPYQMELDGINKQGEVFFSYYFKELNSDQESKKLTYAKLYKDYNWVIAMGIYLDDLQPYMDHIDEESKALVSKLTIILVVLFIAILIISLISVSQIEKSYYRDSKKKMEDEINQDPLTKADSRRSGTNDLGKDFQQFIRTKESPCIAICDIDKFKQINDNYGHNIGDVILIEFVKEVKMLLKSYDKMIRWGGDEFILLLYGLSKEQAIANVSEITSTISNLMIEGLPKEFRFSISVGLSFFAEDDLDYNDAIKRADEALYQSKANGRNQIHMI